MFHHAVRGGQLRPTPLKPFMTYDDHFVWPIHVPPALWAPDHSTSIIMRQCQDKGHISYPQEKPQSTSTGGEGEGGQDGYITLGWGGGGACQTWSIYLEISSKIWVFSMIWSTAIGCFVWRCCGPLWQVLKVKATPNWKHANYAFVRERAQAYMCPNRMVMAWDSGEMHMEV